MNATETNSILESLDTIGKELNRIGAVLRKELERPEETPGPVLDLVMTRGLRGGWTSFGSPALDPSVLPLLDCMHHRYCGGAHGSYRILVTRERPDCPDYVCMHDSLSQLRGRRYHWDFSDGRPTYGRSSWFCEKGLLQYFTEIPKEFYVRMSRV